MQDLFLLSYCWVLCPGVDLNEGYDPLFIIFHDDFWILMCYVSSSSYTYDLAICIAAETLKWDDTCGIDEK